MEFTGKKIGIISPHIDDAFLSLGGFILNEDINLEIINIFTITNYTVNGVFDTKIITKKRKQEEIELASILGYEYMFLDYIDAILRIGEKENDFINPNYDIFNDLIFNDLKKEIILLFLDRKYDLIFFPLGFGSHVDHLIVSKIGKILGKQGFKIVFYEDVAYDEALFDIPQIGMKKYIYKFKNIDTKIKYLKKYKTQIDLETLKLVKQTYYNKKGEVIWYPL